MVVSRNMELLRTSIAEVKDPKNKLALVAEDKQKITDGIRTCWSGNQSYSELQS